MKSFGIRFGVLIGFFAIVISWYLIPDSFFVKYTEASDQYIVQESKKEEKVINKEKKKQDNVENVVEIKKENIKKEQKDINKIKHSVPFIVQAPHAQWDESKYQDACEEASIVMANAWLQGDKYIAKNKAEDEMEKIFNKEQEMFGDVVDTSIKDTAEVFGQYYGGNAQIINGVTMEEMYNILAKGSIIIAPTNGKWLNNPHFTNGGPDRHMLVIIGYDKKNGEFITNDPGTRLGRGYKYKDTTLYNAIRDYKTGNKEDIEGTDKNIMVIKK